MSRSVIETVLGALVLIGAAIFLVFSYSKGDAGTVSGYSVFAKFASIGGLKEGDEVQMSGVKVGQVAKVELDPQSYLATVTLEVDDHIKLPEDTTALISSQSLLGGKYLALEPGGAEDVIPAGGEILYTQAPQNLEELLGKFIFSMKDKGGEAAASDKPASSDAQEVKPVPAPIAPQEDLPESP